MFAKKLKRTNIDWGILVLCIVEQIKDFLKIGKLCKNFRNLANFDAIRPILFLYGQQYHSMRLEPETV